MAKLNEKEMVNPEIKRERLPGDKVTKFKIKDSKGKKHAAKHVQFTEKEIDSVHLVKIAPMFFYCTDNNKILMIPFSIQFSVAETIKMAAQLAQNIKNFLEKEETKN
jgi:hypothetical protein